MKDDDKREKEQSMKNDTKKQFNNQKKKNKKSGFENKNKKSDSKRIYAMAGKCWDGPENDPSWYISEEAIIRDAASLSYANLAGIKYTINQNLQGLNPELETLRVMQEAPQTLPGIMVFSHINTFGQSGGFDGEFDESALTSMTRALYSYVRHANSGSKNYEAPDLGMYILAVDQLYTYIAELQRVYGVLTLYSRVNRYYGKKLVESLGFDYEDLSTQIADFRAYINMLVYKASSLAVPANFSVFARHIWLANNYFTDSASSKANIYAFRPHCYGRFKGYTSDTGSQIHYDVAYMNDRTLEDIKVAGTQLLSPLLSDEDIGIMSGDILKAFGNDNLAKLTLIDENYQVLPVHSLEVLTQIQNMSLPMSTTCVPCSGRSSDTFSEVPKIMQKNGVIVSQIGLYDTVSGTPTNFLRGCTAAGLDRLISMPMDNPTPSDTMVATRLTNIVNDIRFFNYGDNSNVVLAVYNATGTELIVSATIYSMETTANIGLSADHMGNIALLSAFDFHPYVIAHHSEGPTANYLDGFIFESDNYTVLTQTTLSKMHEAAVIGEIFIRSIALAPSR